MLFRVVVAMELETQQVRLDMVVRNQLLVEMVLVKAMELRLVIKHLTEGVQTAMATKQQAKVEMVARGELVCHFRRMLEQGLGQEHQGKLEQDMVQGILVKWVLVLHQLVSEKAKQGRRPSRWSAMTWSGRRWRTASKLATTCVAVSAWAACTTWCRRAAISRAGLKSVRRASTSSIRSVTSSVSSRVLDEEVDSGGLGVLLCREVSGSMPAGPRRLRQGWWRRSWELRLPGALACEAELS